jgi:nitroreductase
MEQNLISILESLNRCQRNWIDDSVSQEHIELLLNVAQSTPTKQNVNYFKVYAVTNDLIKKEIFHYAHSEGVETDSNTNAMPNTTDLLLKNKEFIQKQVTGWIKQQVVDGVSPFNNYTYDESKCHRDIGFIVEALIYDLRFQTNEKIRDIAQIYYVNGVVQVRQFAENAAHNYLKTLINNYILKNLSAPLFQNQVSQTIISGKDGEMTTSITAVSLLQNLIDVIQKGLNYLPSYIAGNPRQIYINNNYNTQVLAPLLLIWCRNSDDTYKRIKTKEYDTELKITHHVSLNVGISSGAVVTTAQLLGYRTGFCGCYNPTDIQKILKNKLNIVKNNFPVIMLGIGMPESNIDTNICVAPIGKKYTRRRQPLARPSVVTI